MINSIIIAAASLIIGAILAWVVCNVILKSKREKLLKEAEAEAEVIKKDKMLQAREKFLQLKADYEKEVNERNARLVVNESKIKQKEAALSSRYDELQRLKKEQDSVRDSLNHQAEQLQKKEEVLLKKEELLNQSQKEQIEKLEALSGLSAEEA
ncbi:MAG: Rnase Y domain-containing protein, partial [Bacteroidales bacterium]